MQKGSRNVRVSRWICWWNRSHEWRYWILGGILAGFLAGYFILFLQKLLTILPKQLDGLKAIFLYPVIGVAFIGIVMSLLAGPMKAINEGMMSF